MSTGQGVSLVCLAIIGILFTACGLANLADVLSSSDYVRDKKVAMRTVWICLGIGIPHLLPPLAMLWITAIGG